MNLEGTVAPIPNRKVNYHEIKKNNGKGIMIEDSPVVILAQKIVAENLIMLILM